MSRKLMDFLSPEDKTLSAEFLKRLAYAETVVPHILAAGVAEGDDHVEPIVRKIGNEGVFSDAMRAITKRLADAGHLGEEVPNPYTDDPGNVGYLDDAMLSRAIEWGAAGYVLGIAVGMRLGPTAFDARGGAK
jgi:hypothetical protein